MYSSRSPGYKTLTSHNKSVLITAQRDENKHNTHNVTSMKKDKPVAPQTSQEAVTVLSVVGTGPMATALWDSFASCGSAGAAIACDGAAASSLSKVQTK